VVRTLTLVSILTLVAGLAVGFFVAEARAVARRQPETAPVDPVIEQRVQLYEQYFSLDGAQSAEVRAALREYNQGLLDLLRRLRVQHRDDFKALSDRADARINAAVGRNRDR
jgi:hypothetical protein